MRAVLFIIMRRYRGSLIGALKGGIAVSMFGSFFWLAALAAL